MSRKAVRVRSSVLYKYRDLQEDRRSKIRLGTMSGAICCNRRTATRLTEGALHGVGGLVTHVALTSHGLGLAKRVVNEHVFVASAGGSGAFSLPPPKIIGSVTTIDRTARQAKTQPRCSPSDSWTRISSLPWTKR
jgi:hypothetical protein